MKYKVVFTSKAYDDLDSIFEYISVNLDVPSAAKRFNDKVEKFLTDISEFPFMYPLCYYASIAKRNYRKAVMDNYIVFFKPDESTKTVTVYRIIYGKRNLTEFI